MGQSMSRNEELNMISTKMFNTDLQSMNTAREGCAAVVHEGKLFVIGGLRLKSSEIYDLATKKWIPLSNSMSTVGWFAAAVSYGDRIIVINGSVEQYDPLTMKWSSFPSMNSKRVGCAAAVVDGKVIVVGGYGVGNGDIYRSGEEYNPATEKWVEIPPMNFKRSGCAAAVLDDQLYIVGGFHDDGIARSYLSSAEVYNPTTKAWTLLPDMSTARAYCAAVTLGGKIVVTGGYSGSDNLASCEAYDSTKRQWSIIASMHTKRTHCAAVEAEGNLYVIGGRSDGGKQLSTMESLSIQPGLQTKSTISPLFCTGSQADQTRSSRFSNAIQISEAESPTADFTEKTPEDQTSTTKIPQTVCQPQQGVSTGELTKIDTGMVIASFILHGALGSGSFGTVFKAKKVVAEITVTRAIKVLVKDDNSLRHKQMNKNEIAILQQYRHENIVFLYDVHETEKHLYLILEFCKGGNLGRLIETRKSGRLSEHLIRWLLHDLSAGLKFLHFEHILHRDIKPQNLLLTGPLPLVLDGKELGDVAMSEEEEKKRREVNFPADKFLLKIADFGLARELNPDSLAETACGTPYYMAPEIKLHQRHGLEADIYSTGKVVLQMITGHPSLTAPNESQLPNELDGKGMSRKILPLLELCLSLFPIDRSPEKFFQACDNYLDISQEDLDEQGGDTVTQTSAQIYDDSDELSSIMESRSIQERNDNTSREEMIKHEEKKTSASESLDLIPFNQNLLNVSTEKVCQWLSQHGISSASLDIIRQEEIDGVFFFTESFDEIKMVLKDKGMKVGQLSRLCLAIENARKEGFLDLKW